MDDYDVAIIGAGIVGLATAMALADKRAGLKIAVLEKEGEPATHQTGHNSGVIHAGLYYQPGSLKARLCVDGRRRLLDFCDEHAIPVGRCGKVVVATDPEQLNALAELNRRAKANGVETEELGPSGITDREPHVRGVAGLWVADTAVVDFQRVAQTYAAVAQANGVAVLTNFEVVGTSRTGKLRTLQSATGSVGARVVVNCGGLYVDRLARLLGHRTKVEIVPFRGEYLGIRRERAELVQGLVYPVPDPRFPFLGVHFTKDLDGHVEVGPNAVLAGAREGYRRRDVNIRDVRDMLTFPGLYRLAAAHMRTAVGEMWRSLVKSAFAREAARLIPELQRSDLTGYRAGVRAQAMMPDGTLLQDFAIEETADAIHVLNAPSPAATASLAIGDYVADRVVKKLAG